MYVIYETATGRLISQTTDAGLIANPLNPAYTVKQVAEPAAGYVWHEGTLDFVAPPASPIITKLDFINRFTTVEQKHFFKQKNVSDAALTVAQTDNVYAFLQYLTYLDRIDLTSTAIVNGVNYLENVGVLGAGRAAQILA